jgi:hypothetical protein
MIFVIASIGTAKIAPGTPHIQYQKMSAMIEDGVESEAPRQQHGRDSLALDKMDCQVQQGWQQGVPQSVYGQ